MSRAGTLIFFNSNEIEFGTTYAEACCRIRVGPLSSHSQTRLKPDLLIRSLCLILSLAYNWLLISLGPARDFRRERGNLTTVNDIAELVDAVLRRNTAKA